MLKIKDNVDLKELEKFGFKYYEKGEFWCIEKYYSDANIFVNKDKTIDFEDEWWGKDFELLDILFDLIQAGLIEKVKENV